LIRIKSDERRASVALTLRPRPGLMSAASTRRLLLARRFAETLVYAGAGSAALGLAGLPAGWLSGAIVGVSAAALSGRPMFVPPQVGRAVYVILGISLGSSVTPETVATMVTWPAEHAGAHRRDGRHHGVGDGVPEIRPRLADARRFVRGLRRARSRRRWRSRRTPAQTCAPIAMVQTVRLFILAVALPLIFAAFGVAGLPPPRGGNLPLLQSAGNSACWCSPRPARRCSRSASTCRAA
jgi:hypothetical protein